MYVNLASLNQTGRVFFMGPFNTTLMQDTFDLVSAAIVYLSRKSESIKRDRIRDLVEDPDLENAINEMDEWVDKIWNALDPLAVLDEFIEKIRNNRYSHVRYILALTIISTRESERVDKEKISRLLFQLFSEQWVTVPRELWPAIMMAFTIDNTRLILILSLIDPMYSFVVETVLTKLKETLGG